MIELTFRKIFRRVFIAPLVLLLITQASAQPFSYVYIQGDKNTPFYVKLEGQMMPRYGKNYCILSELSPGLIHIEILFQQHAFHPKKFTIRVPENGYRGLMLCKQDTTFVFYDLLAKKYLGTNEEQ
jgi:hypothetical protein